MLDERVPAQLYDVAARLCPVFQLSGHEEFWPCDANDLLASSFVANPSTHRPFSPPPPAGAADAIVAQLRESVGANTYVTASAINACGSKSICDRLPKLSARKFSGWIDEYSYVRNFTLCLLDGRATPIVRARPTDFRKVPVYVRIRKHPTELNEWYITYAHVYAYNGATSIVGDFGAHEADLEHVTLHVKVGPYNAVGAALLRVYFSQHFGGHWIAASDQRLHTVRGGRPRVFVAAKSHASYPEAGTTHRFWGAANDVCDSEGPEWDPVRSLVFLDRIDRVRSADRWMLTFVGTLGDTHVSSFVRQSFWSATDKDRNAGTGICFSIS